MPDPVDDDTGRFWGPRLLWSALAAVALGAAYALVAGCLKESIAAIPDAPSGDTGRGPLTFFLLIGGAGGWILAMLTERIWGWTGAVLFVPLLAQTLLAAAIGTLLCNSLFGPKPGTSVALLVVAAIATLIAGGVKIYWESL